MKRTSFFSAASLTALIASFLASGLCSCVNLERSRASGYADRDTSLNESRDRRQSQRDETASTMGYTGANSLSARDSELLEDRISLGKAEKALEGRREREQYFRNKPYMRSDAERLEFLSGGSFETRQRWLNAKNINPTAAQNSPEIQYLIDVNDITLGMTKQAVRDSWGEPETVEISGNPIYGNERWHYSEQTSSTEGYQTQNRLVVFESGRVIGWESR